VAALTAQSNAGGRPVSWDTIVLAARVPERETGADPRTFLGGVSVYADTGPTLGAVDEGDIVLAQDVPPATLDVPLSVALRAESGAPVGAGLPLLVTIDLSMPCGEAPATAAAEIPGRAGPWSALGAIAIGFVIVLVPRSGRLRTVLVVAALLWVPQMGCDRGGGKSRGEGRVERSVALQYEILQATFRAAESTQEVQAAFRGPTIRVAQPDCP